MLINDDGIGLLLADANDPKAFAAHVRALLVDASLRDRLGTGAAELYAREFAWPRIAARMMNALAMYDAKYRPVDQEVAVTRGAAL